MALFVEVDGAAKGGVGMVVVGDAARGKRMFVTKSVEEEGEGNVAVEEEEEEEATGRGSGCCELEAGHGTASTEEEEEEEDGGGTAANAAITAAGNTDALALSLLPPSLFFWAFFFFFFSSVSWRIFLSNASSAAFLSAACIRSNAVQQLQQS
eukprot:evm.model.NODE_18089_length_1603_cov_14.062383.1